MARYTLLPQLPAPRPKGFKSTGYLNDPRIYTLINHAFQVVFEKIVENSVLQEEEEFVFCIPRSINNPQRQVYFYNFCQLVSGENWYSWSDSMFKKKKHTGNPWISSKKTLTLQIGLLILTVINSLLEISFEDTVITRVCCGRERGTFKTGESAPTDDDRRRRDEHPAFRPCRRGDIFSTVARRSFSSISGGGRRPSREAAAPLMFLYLATSHLFTGLRPSINYWPQLFPP